MNAQRWFEVSDEGFVRQQAGRPAVEVVRELVQNAFDANNATQIDVMIAKDNRHATVVVQDNGDGFVDSSLVYTVFLSGKSDDPTKRGRKGRGLKEAIAAASESAVSTVGRTIIFSRDGKNRIRNQHSNSRKSGSSVELVIHRWTRDDVAEIVHMLGTFEPPPGVVFTVNGRKIDHHTVKHEVPARLQTTTIDDGVEVRCTRNTVVRLLEPRLGEEPSIMEMGIPICPVDMPWHLDVGQRVPLPDHRTTVPLAYARKLKLQVLDEIADKLGPSELKSEWVTEVLADTSAETKIHYTQTVYGKNVAIRTPGDQESNIIAEEDLHLRVIDTGHLPTSVREVLRQSVPSTKTAVRLASGQDTTVMSEPGASTETQRERVEPTDGEAAVCRLSAWAASKILGRRVDSWVEREVKVFGNRALACWTGSAIIWSRNYSGKFYDNPLAPVVLGVLIHEIAHGLSHEHGHGPEFTRALEKAAGKMAELMMVHGDEARVVASDGER